MVVCLLFVNATFPCMSDVAPTERPGLSNEEPDWRLAVAGSRGQLRDTAIRATTDRANSTR